MATDYVLFVHGVNTRDRAEFQTRAGELTQALRQRCPRHQIEAISPFWGNISEAALQPLRDGFGADPLWSKIWFRPFREGLTLNFVGDAMLYISRTIGGQVVDAIYEQAIATLQQAQPGDRLHLVTHSWGTVILFDILFAGRWESQSFARFQPVIHDNVSAIRNALFGLGTDPETGLRLASLHTMGSPIALFNLVNVNGTSGHDLTPELKSMLRALYAVDHQPLPWLNYLHPGDPLAYPLTGISSSLFGEAIAYLALEDRLVRSSTLLDKLVGLFPQTLVPLIQGGTAHGCYWDLESIAEAIATTIQA